MTSRISEFGGWRGLVAYTLVTSLISGAVIAGVLKWALDKELAAWNTTRMWQQSALSEVVAPASMHLSRTSALAERYRVQPRYGEALLLRDSNTAVRALLLEKSHLLSSELLGTSECLLTHYDIWLKRFDLSLAGHKASHGGSEPAPDEHFDVGYASMESEKCGGFPVDAPGQFRREYDALRAALYDLPPTGG